LTKADIPGILQIANLSWRYCHHR